MSPQGIQGLSFAVISPIEAQAVALYNELIAMVEGMVLTNTLPGVVATAINQKVKEIEDYCSEQLSISLPIVYNTAYRWTILEEQAKAGIRIVNASEWTANWCADGKNFRDRILVNNERTLASISGLLLSGQEDKNVLLGLLTDELKRAQNSWLRLVRTEAEASYSQGVRDALIALGCLYAVIDNPDPCDRICVDEVGERRVTLAEARVGLDLPPFHPNCKCVFRGIWMR